MIKYYRVIVQDTFKVLNLNKIYPIKDERYILNDRENAIIFGVTRYMLENMFEEIKK